MNTAHAWWREPSERGAPRAWWLGLFRRQVRLRAYPASRLTVPAINVFPAQRLLLSADDSLSLPQRLAGELPLASAKNLTIDLIPAANAENGSVNLIGVLLNTEPTSRLALPRRAVASEHSFSEIRPPMAAQIPLWRRLAYLLQPPTDLLLAQRGPLEWPGPLFDYQLAGIHALMSHEALLLADDMGLGKTIQTIAALRLLVLQHRVESILLIVRAGLVNQWRKELQGWAPELRISTIRGPTAERAWQWSTPAHVYLVSYETFRADFTDNLHSPPRRRVWDIVILDEAQAIKNRDAEVSSKCKRLYRRRAWALTGTPLENSAEELASILEFVSPLAEGETPQRLMPGPELRERHARVQLRRKKSEVLPQLPPKIASRIALKLEGSQRASYERAEREGRFDIRKPP